MLDRVIRDLMNGHAAEEFPTPFGGSIGLELDGPARCITLSFATPDEAYSVTYDAKLFGLDAYYRGLRTEQLALHGALRETVAAEARRIEEHSPGNFKRIAGHASGRLKALFGASSTGRESLHDWVTATQLVASISHVAAKRLTNAAPPGSTPGQCVALAQDITGSYERLHTLAQERQMLDLYR